MNAPVNEGDILAGKYQVEKVLGAGGMGVVVAAMHLQLEQRVALKFLLPQALGNPEAVTRFLREGRAAVRLRSEHVARVSDVGTLENGSPYMVMEYLEGSDLAALLHSQGRLSVETAIDYVLQACEAIAEAHAAGIVHRDLKPANLFFTLRPDGSPCIKVLDFGISKLSSMNTGSDMGMTKTTAIMGSPYYMSPEQMRSSRKVDLRADIWALGIILYELLTGETPFKGDTLPELCATVLTEPPPRVRERRPDAPSGLEAALLHSLEKDPTQRYANVGEFARDLAPFGPPDARISVERITRLCQTGAFSASSSTPQQGVAKATVPTVTGMPTAAAWGATGTDANKERNRKNLLVLAAAGATVLLLGGGVGIALWAKDKGGGHPSGAASAMTSAPASSVVAQPLTAEAAMPAPSRAVVGSSSSLGVPPAGGVNPTLLPEKGNTDKANLDTSNLDKTNPEKPSKGAIGKTKKDELMPPSKVGPARPVSGTRDNDPFNTRQ